MKKILMFASAIVISLAAVSCDEITDGTEDDDDVTNNDDEVVVAGTVKELRLTFNEDETEEAMYYISYDSDGRVTKIEIEETFTYDEYYGTSAKLGKSSLAQLTARRIESRQEAVATRAATRAEGTYSATVTYEYDGTAFTASYTSYEDGDMIYEDSETAYGTLNSDGSLATLSAEGSYMSESWTYDDATGEWVVVSEETWTYTSEETYSYSGGYLSYAEESDTHTDEYGNSDSWSDKYDFVWSNSNLTKIVNTEYYDSNNEWLYDHIYTYGSDLNNLSIDLVMVFAFNSDYILPFDRTIFGTAAKNLLTSDVYYSYDDSGNVDWCSKSEYEYEYTDGLLTKIICSYGSGDSLSEADADMEEDTYLEIIYN